MKVFICVDKNNRVQGWGSTKGDETDIEIEIHENHDALTNPFIFKYENGQLLKDEAYQQQLIAEQKAKKNQPTTEEKLALMQQALDDLILAGGGF